MRNPLQQSAEFDKKRRVEAAKSPSPAKSEFASGEAVSQNAADMALDSRLPATARQDAVMRMQQAQGNAAVLRKLRPGSATRLQRAPASVIQRTPQVYSPRNVVGMLLTRPIDPQSVIDECRTRGGNATNRLGDSGQNIFDSVGNGTMESLVRSGATNLINTGSWSSGSLVFDPGLTYANFAMTISLTLMEDNIQVLGGGASSTVGSSTTAANALGNSTTQGTSGTLGASLGGTGTSGSETPTAGGGKTTGGSGANAGVTGSVGTTLGSGTTGSTQLGGGGTATQASDTQVVTSDLSVRVSINVRAYDILGARANRGRIVPTFVVPNVGAVRYSRPSIQVVPPPPPPAPVPAPTPTPVVAPIPAGATP